MKNVILKLILISFILRFFLITFAVFISNFPKLHIPKYQYDVAIINNKFDYKDQNKSKYLKIKGKKCLKGDYNFPISTFFGFLSRNNNFNLNSLSFDESNKVEHEESVNIEKLNRFWLLLIPFISWDGERFLINSLNNLIYTKEESCAFFPFYSYLLNLIANFTQKILKFFNISTPRPFLLILIGFILNNILSICSSVLIYLILSKSIFSTESRIKTLPNKVKSKKPNKVVELKVTDQDGFSKSAGLFSTLLYNISPGFIFTTALYTEPLYTTLNYSVILLVYKLNSQLKQESDSNVDYKKVQFSKVSFNQFLIELIVVFLIFVNCLTRSNGILLLIPFSLYLLKTLPLYHLIKSKLLRTHTTINNKNLKRLDPNNKVNFIFKFVLINFCYVLKFLCYLYILLLPFSLIQLYGYKLFCNQLVENNKLIQSRSNFRIDNFIKNNILINPISLIKLFIPKKLTKSLYTSVNSRLYRERGSVYGNEFCRNGFNLIYKHVQNKYWGLKLFYSFDSWNHFVHFIYTFPNLLLVMIYLYRVRRNLKRKRMSFINLMFEFVENYELNLIFHLIVNFLPLILFSHIQIFFRQSLTLIQFLFQFAAILHYFSRNKGNLSNFYKLLYIYNITLCFVGIILFSNFVGWT